MGRKKIHPELGKEYATITFDRAVFEKLKEKAQKENSSISHLVNFVCKNTFLKDSEYFKHLAKYHCAEFHKYKYLKDTFEE